MNRFHMRGLGAGIALGLASLSTAAAAQTWSATMNGANEAPPNASAGTGFALLTLAGNTLTITGSFSGLTGTTSAAHLHCCTASALTGTVGVATITPAFTGFPLTVTGGSFILPLDLTSPSSYNAAFVTNNGGTTAGAQARLIQGFNDGTVYFNIHTTSFAGGEIRGFVTTVPEPSTVILLAGGLAAVGVMARRRRGVLSAPRA